MNKIFSLIALLWVSFCQAQMVGTNVFLQGNYVEIGIQNNGAFGATGVPVGYHPHTSLGTGVTGAWLAEVYDIGHDGWTTGTPAFMGDYTYPGSSFEGWEIQVGSARTQAFQGGSGGGSLSVISTGYLMTADGATNYWVGNTSGGIQIRKEVLVRTNASSVVIKVTLKNLYPTTPSSHIYYLRTCDPDVDQTWAGGAFTTNNTIVYQNDTEHRVLVQASGTIAGASLSLGAKDARAKAFTYSSWPIPIGVDLATVYAGTAYGVTSALGSTVTGDNAIGLVFNIGSIPAGDSITFSYGYIFNGAAGIDLCLINAGEVMPNTGSACSTTGIILNNVGYSVSSDIALQWQSSPDSITWTDIAGATSVPYSFSGLSATTYYRLKATSISGGLSVYSAGFKVIYITPCACIGAPIFYTANASTSYCSSCSFTLNLAGIPSLTGYTYQWERSLTGTFGWANIPGATTVPYTYSPDEAYYYRCKVTCSAGGTSNSSSVFVGYAYRIIDDSVNSSIDTACTFARVFTKVNGISPLLTLKTFYGDASHDSTALTPFSLHSYASVLHNYPLPGCYSIKQILYHKNVPQDSILRFFEQVPCKTISIRVFIDSNANGNKDYRDIYNSTPVLIRVDSNSIPIDTIQTLSGLYYKVTGMSGSAYQFSILPSDRLVTFPTLGTHTVTLSSSSVFSEILFGISCGPIGLRDLAVYSDVLWALSNRGGWSVFPRSNYCIPESGILKMKYSFKYNSLSPIYSHLPSYTSLPYFEWTIPTRTASSPVLKMRYSTTASPYLTIGDTVVTQVIFVPDSGPDFDISNNMITRIDTVKAPYDPNVIEVNPAGCFDTTNQFRFTVHFENLGNDTAHNVHVLDTLSPNLDPSSIEVVMSSAEIMNTYFYTEAGYNIVKFDFPNIKLLDSSWDGLNEGMFIYDIKRRPDMPDGASILSRVGIYFDYNDVVMTNTTENRKGCPISTRLTSADAYRKVSLFPNPTTGYLTIKTETNTFTSFAITNAIGQQVWQQGIQKTEERVNLAHLPAGVYYVTFKGDGVSEVRKFVKW